MSENGIDIKKKSQPETESFNLMHDITNDPNAPFLTKLFQESHIELLVGFLAVYIFVYVLFGAYIKSVTGGTSESNDTLMSKIFDYLLFSVFIIYCAIVYLTSSDYIKTHLIETMIEWTVRMYNDPITMFATGLFIVTFYLLVYLIQIPMIGVNKPYSVSILEQKAWIFFATLVIYNFFKYILGIDMIDYVSNNPQFISIWNAITSDTPLKVSGNVSGNISGNVFGNVSGNKFGQISGIFNVSQNILGNVSGNVVKPDEVFNISNNLYSYDDAQAICTSYGARLANYDEIEDAYNHGGEWCNYGWSEGQMILFPTQKNTWDTLQKNEKTKNNCGRPGINGGFINNPNVKFGVNCFGKKPVPTDAELAMMSVKQNQPVPLTAEQTLLDKKVKFWKENADKLLKVNSFNGQKWSEY